MKYIELLEGIKEKYIVNDIMKEVKDYKRYNEIKKELEKQFTKKVNHTNFEREYNYLELKIEDLIEMLYLFDKHLKLKSFELTGCESGCDLDLDFLEYISKKEINNIIKNKKILNKLEYGHHIIDCNCRCVCIDDEYDECVFCENNESCDCERKYNFLYILFCNNK